jgi:hypothetical protein
MLGASGVPNKLFIAFLFNNPDIGIHFLKDVRLVPSPQQVRYVISHTS